MKDLFDGKDINVPGVNVANTNTEIPVNIGFDENFHSFFQNSAPYQAPKILEKPGFIDTAKRAFYGANEFAQISNYVERSAELGNPLDDVVPANYKPTDDLSNFDGLDKKYWGFIMQASGPQDAKRRYYNAIQNQQNEQLVSNGSLLGALSGGLAGSVTSPSVLIPIAGEAKYATFEANVLRNMARAYPGMASQAITHSAIEQTTAIGGNLEDFAVNAYRDAIMGTAFMGAAGGLSHSFTAGKLFQAKGALNLAYEGIDIRPIVKADGSVTGYKATSGLNNVGAAKLDEAQKFLDSTMAQNGLFAVPYIGGWLGKGAAKANPIIRMLNSPFETMRGFIDRVADHGLVTQGIEKGYASPDKFEVLMAQLGGDNKSMFYQLKGLHLQRNGIEGSRGVGNIKKVAKKWTDQGYVSEEDFGKEIRDVLINDSSSPHGAVNEAASLLREKMDDSYRAFRAAYNLPESWLPPKTAEGYLNRVYDIGQMKLRPDEWENVLVEWMKTADAEINSHLQPIEDLKSDLRVADANHANLLRQSNITDEEVKTSARNVEGIRRRIQVMQNELSNRLREDTSLRMHIDDWQALSANEAKQLNELLKPLQDLERQIDAQQKIVSELKTVASRKTQAAKKGKTVKTAKSNLEVVDKNAKSLVNEENKLRELQDQHDIYEEQLQERAMNGEIDPILYERIPNSQRVKFKDPANRLKFRELYTDEFHMKNAAKGYYDTILNQTAEDTISQVLGQMLGHTAENPLAKRTLMIPDQVLYDNNFLMNNLAINVMNYRNTLGRKTFLKTVFGDVTLDGGITPIVERLATEFKVKKSELQSQLAKLKADGAPAKQIQSTEKLLDTLQKQFTDAKKNMNLTYNKMMGRNRGSEAQRTFSNVTRSFAAAIRLGAVPLTMVTDMMAIVYKHGFWPFLRDGLAPMLQNIDGLIKSGNGKAYVENAAHAHLGMNDFLSAYSDRNWAGTAQPYEPMMNPIKNAVEHLAHMSSNLAGTNYIENGLQRMTASVVQSKVMKYMIDYKAGTLTKSNEQKLLIYGLDPKKWADRFIDEWKARGSDGNGFGGYQSRYWEWNDLEAANKMSETILRGTRDTIIRRGMFDAPFFLDDPLWGAILTFKGWTFASLTRYLTPLMQQPDAEKLLGTMMMLGAGALVDPLRRMSRGEDAMANDENMYWAAVTNSGIFSFLTDSLEDINILTGGTLLKNIKNDRYRERTFFGVAGGPLGGIAEDLYRIAGMTASGEYNQTDVNKMARLLPFTQTWYLRGLSNKMVEGLDLPKSRAAAAAENG